MSEEEEVTETLQRTRKIIPGTRRNRNSSECETRQQSRVRWQLSEEQQKDAHSRLFSFWQLIGGESSTPPSSIRELEAATEEISIPLSQPKETSMNDKKVIDYDLKTTEDNANEPEICTMEPIRRSSYSPRK